MFKIKHSWYHWLVSTYDFVMLLKYHLADFNNDDDDHDQDDELFLWTCVDLIFSREYCQKFSPPQILKVLTLYNFLSFDSIERSSVVVIATPQFHVQYVFKEVASTSTCYSIITRCDYLSTYDNMISVLSNFSFSKTFSIVFITPIYHSNPHILLGNLESIITLNASLFVSSVGKLTKPYGKGLIWKKYQILIWR